MEERHDWLPFFVSFIIILIVAAGFTILYYQLTSRIAQSNNAISQLTDQVASFPGQLTTEDSKISSLNNQFSDLLVSMASNNATLSVLNDKLSDASSQLSGFTQQLNSITSDIGTLKDDNTSSSSQITALQNQLNSFQTQLSSTQSTITSLQSQISAQQSAIASAAQAASVQGVLFTSHMISEGPSTSSLVYSFTTAYSGYLTISGTSNSATGYILIANSTSGVTATYNFGTGTTLNIPLNAGNTFSIYFGNRDSVGTIVAALNGTYQSSVTQSYYSQVALFTSQSISEGPNTSALVYSFTPPYSGYITITGTSNSATGYIEITDTSTGEAGLYNFGTGTTLNIPLNTNDTYSIYFGNRDSVGTIVATLNGTYLSSVTQSYSGQVALFTSQSISETANTFTLVYTFTPTYTGALTLTGTSSSATAYILIVNNSTGNTNSYTFGVGTTLNLPMTGGNTYSIYFGNHDNSGTITGLLSGTYHL